MSVTNNSTVVDALIIGGGPAGVSAALSLARALHTVIVFDSGIYRNAKAARMHAVTTLSRRWPKGYFISLTNTVLCGGVGNFFSLLDVAGYSDCWVTGIFHCLFCHGYEDRHVPSCGVLCAGDLEAAQPVLHLARHAARLVPKVTIYTNGREELTDQIKSLLREDEEFTFDSRTIDKLAKGDEEASVVLRFSDASHTTEGFLVNRPKTVLQSEFASQLGCKMTKQGSIEITEPVCQTSVPGAFAAGDCAVLAKTVMNAMATGGFAGAAIAMQLEAEGPSPTSKTTT